MDNRCIKIKFSIKEYINMMLSLKKYEDVICTVVKLLDQNSEWEKRYKGYIDKLSDDSFIIAVSNAHKLFYKPKSFNLYLPLSSAMKVTNKNITFDMRFHGQSVGSIIVKDKKVFFKKKTNVNIKKLLNYDNNPGKLFLWNGANGSLKEARKFKLMFAELEKDLKNPNNSISLSGQPEHEMESYLLDNFSKKSSDGKKIFGIQPVSMPNTYAKFQMPTPITASMVNKGVNNIKYANQYGGGIDILARIGFGWKTKLSILELKDENKTNEPPEAVMSQAIAYATFIDKLIRSKVADGTKWWKFFGFSGVIPKELRLKAVVVMPYREDAESAFSKHELLIPGTNDIIELEYIYLGKKIITSLEQKR